MDWLHSGTEAEDSGAIYSVLADIGALAAIEPEWNDLCARATGHYLGQTFGWVRLCWETVVRPRGQRIVCVIERRRGRLSLAWPLALERRRTLTLLRPLDSQATEYSTVLVEDCNDAARRIAAAWDVLRTRCRADVLVLPNVRSDSPLEAAIGARAERRACIFNAPAPWAFRPADWNGTVGNGSTDYKEVQRRRRQLARQGHLVVETLDDPADAIPVVDWLLRQKVARMSAKSLRNDWIGAPETRDFLHASIAAFAPSGQRVVFALKLDGAVIAALMGSVDATRFESFLTAFAPEYARSSPGQVLQEAAVRWAFERGLHFDFRIGAEPYKRLWCDRAAAVSSHVCALTPRGALRVRRIEAVQALKRLARNIPAPLLQRAKRLARAHDSR